MSADASPARHSVFKRTMRQLLYVCIAFVCIAAAWYFLKPQTAKDISPPARPTPNTAAEPKPAPVSNEVIQLRQTVNELNTRVQTLEEEIKELVANAPETPKSNIAELIGILPGALQQDVGMGPPAPVAPASIENTENIQQPENNALAERLAALELQLQNMQQQQVSDEKLNAILAMKEQLNTLNNTVSAGKNDNQQHARLLMAYDRLEKNVLSGEPFEHALRAMRIAFSGQNDSAIWTNPLVHYEQEGIPTQAELAQLFESALRGYSTRVAEQPATVWEGVWQNVSGLVSVRKVGAAHTGSDSDSRVARAEVALKEEKLEQAIEEISALATNEKMHFTEWLKQSKIRQQALLALQSVEQRVMDAVEKVTLGPPATSAVESVEPAAGPALPAPEENLQPLPQITEPGQ